MKLCTLENVKLLLGIKGDSENSRIELVIGQVSASVCAYLGYNPEIKDYVELQAVTGSQLLQLNHFPIRNVSSVKYDGAEITDYKVLPQYSKNGQLYRGNGWGGAYYTRGMTYDVVSGAYNYEIAYKAGWYLPDSAQYDEGNEDSLPTEISSACMYAVAESYSVLAEGALGIKSRTEGGISTTYGNAFGETSTGLSAKVMAMLDPYRMVGVA